MKKDSTQLANGPNSPNWKGLRSSDNIGIIKSIGFHQIDSLQLQLQITTDARDQFEKQLHESLQTVKEQRERHTQQQKDIHDLKQRCIMNSWEMDANGRKYNHDEHPIVKQITEEYKSSQPLPTPGLVLHLKLPLLQFFLLCIFFSNRLSQQQF